MRTVHRVEGEAPSHPDRTAGRRRRRGVVLVGLIVVALVIAFGVVSIVTRNDNAPAPATTTTASPTTTIAPSTTSGPATTTSIAAPSESTAVWPYPGGATYSEPVAAAREFATRFLGFVAPVVGAFRAGDARSGEVEVKPVANGPVTTVLLRQLGPDQSWSVLGSATPDIVVDRPSALATVSSPVALSGRSTAFEATVSVEVRQTGGVTLARGIVMGGSNGEMGPFEGSIAFAVPTAATGAVVFSTNSMADGRIWEASVVPVRFATGSSAPASQACASTPSPHPDPVAGTMEVTAYFTCGGVDGTPRPVYRLTATSAARLRSSLDQLLGGPTSDELKRGFSSWFTWRTSGLLDQVVIRADGTAVVDFHDLRLVIPEASSSAGSRLLLQELDATVFQFSSVKSAIYRLEGDCEAFTEWLQFGGCDPRTRS